MGFIESQPGAGNPTPEQPINQPTSPVDNLAAATQNLNAAPSPVNEPNGILGRRTSRRAFLGGLVAGGTAIMFGRNRLAHAEEEEPAPTVDPTPTPTPTEEINNIQPAVATPEAQSREFPYMYNLTDVKTSVEPVKGGFRKITAEWVDPTGADKLVQSSTIPFVARPSTSERTNTINHEPLQIASSQAFMIYRNMIERDGTDREKHHLRTVMESLDKSTQPMQPRTSADITPQYLKLYAMQFDEKDVDNAPAFVNGVTKYYPDGKGSNGEPMPRIIEHQLQFFDTGLKYKGQDGKFGNDFYFHRVSISVILAERAYAINAAKNNAGDTINLALGGDGANGEVLEQVANSLPARLAVTYDLLEDLIKKYTAQQEKPQFNDPTGEAAKMVRLWNAATTEDTPEKVVKRRLQVAGFQLGKAASQMSDADLEAARILVGVN